MLDDLVLDLVPERIGNAPAERSIRRDVLQGGVATELLYRCPPSIRNVA